MSWHRKYRGVSKYDLKLPITHPYDFFFQLSVSGALQAEIESIGKKKRNKYHSIVFKKGFKFNITSIGGTQWLELWILCDCAIFFLSLHIVESCVQSHLSLVPYLSFCIWAKNEELAKTIFCDFTLFEACIENVIISDSWLLNNIYLFFFCNKILKYSFYCTFCSLTNGFKVLLS